MHKQPGQCISVLSLSFPACLSSLPSFLFIYKPCISTLGRSYTAVGDTELQFKGLMKCTDNFYLKMYDPHFQTFESEMQATWILIAKAFLTLHDVETHTMVCFKGSLLIVTVFLHTYCHHKHFSSMKFYCIFYNSMGEDLNVVWLDF